MLISINELKESLKRALKIILWADFFARKSYSQEGEDLVVDRMLEGKKVGFYVDVGAHHPYRYSNTYLFYKKGWKGVNIDPLPGLKTLFSLRRPRDIFVNMGVSLKPSKLNYFAFNEPALNTFNPTLASKRNGDKTYKIIAQNEVMTDTLASILKSVNCPREIDLLSVDVEGLDLEVLESNDWTSFNPKIIVVECLASDLVRLPEDPIYLFLINLGYKMNAKTGHSVIFQRN